MAFATGVVLAMTGPGGMFLVYGPLVILTGLGTWVFLRLPTSTATPSRAGRRVSSGGAGQALAGLSPATILGVLRTPRLDVLGPELDGLRRELDRSAVGVRPRAGVELQKVLLYSVGNGLRSGKPF